jgi:hypothetical protein
MVTAAAGIACFAAAGISAAVVAAAAVAAALHKMLALALPGPGRIGCPAPATAGLLLRGGQACCPGS